MRDTSAEDSFLFFMRITNIVATNMELTDAIRAYVEEKLLGLAKFCEGYSPCDCAVEVGRTSQHHQKGEVWRAEAHLTIPGASIHAEHVAEELYAAIDAVKDEVKRQLLERKDRA